LTNLTGGESGVERGRGSGAGGRVKGEAGG
jgi:hypothetical protein